MLEHVIRDDEVERLVLELRQVLRLVDHVGRDELGGLRVEPPQLVSAGVVDVADPRRARDPQRPVESADLDPVAAEVAERQVIAGSQPVRRARPGNKIAKLPPRPPRHGQPAGLLAKPGCGAPDEPVPEGFDPVLVLPRLHLTAR